MADKSFNPYFIVVGLALIIITAFILLTTGHVSGASVPVVWGIYLAGFALLTFGMVNYIKMSLWIKIVLSILLAPMLILALFLLIFFTIAF